MLRLTTPLTYQNSIWVQSLLLKWGAMASEIPSILSRRWCHTTLISCHGDSSWCCTCYIICRKNFCQRRASHKNIAKIKKISKSSQLSSVKLPLEQSVSSLSQPDMFTSFYICSQRITTFSPRRTETNRKQSVWAGRNDARSKSCWWPSLKRGYQKSDWVIIPCSRVTLYGLECHFRPITVNNQPY